MYQVKELGRRGYSQNQMAKQLKLPPFAVKIAMGQSRTFQEKDLLNILDVLADADYKMKSGKMEKRLLLELAMAQIMGS